MQAALAVSADHVTLGVHVTVVCEESLMHIFRVEIYKKYFVLVRGSLEIYLM